MLPEWGFPCASQWGRGECRGWEWGEGWTRGGGTGWDYVYYSLRQSVSS